MPCLPNWIPRRKKSAAPVTPTKWWKISENKFSIPFHRHPLRCRNEAKDTQTPQHSATHSTPPLSFLEFAIFSGCMPSMRSKVSWYSSKIFQLLTWSWTLATATSPPPGRRLLVPARRWKWKSKTNYKQLVVAPAELTRKSKGKQGCGFPLLSYPWEIWTLLWSEFCCRRVREVSVNI